MEAYKKIRKKHRIIHKKRAGVFSKEYFCPLQVFQRKLSLKRYEYYDISNQILVEASGTSSP